MKATIKDVAGVPVVSFKLILRVINNETAVSDLLCEMTVTEAL